MNIKSVIIKYGKFVSKLWLSNFLYNKYDRTYWDKVNADLHREDSQ